MDDYLHRAVAVVGVGALMPDAPDATTFWTNIRDGRYSITEIDPARWDPDLYYDPDPKAPDKTYSKIGGWVRDWDWDPRSWKLPIMPRVAEAMDDGQKWAVACTHQALSDYGYPERSIDNERVAVVLGNALAGEKHYETALRVAFPEVVRELSQASSFDALPNDVQRAIIEELHSVMDKRYPEITEDSMPGELSNCIAGRVANLYNFRGPNYTVDAACASAMAATASSVGGLVDGEYDAVITGGIDRNMGAAAYVKFCKIGALSATGTRPYAEGADGFVMGEGAAIFLLKRLQDAIDADDHIYAVLLGIAGSSDGKGKGITAPNPIGQRLAVERAWRNAGLAPQTATLIEGHGTSTRVGDVVEHQSMAEVFDGSGIAPGSIALGSVKSNIGHLKGAAGAAGMFKVVMSLHDRVLPPSLNFRAPNPDIDFAHSPFRVNTELREWDRPDSGIRRAGVSAFGFGGTNFHAVFEEHVADGGRDGRKTVAVPESKVSVRAAAEGDVASASEAGPGGRAERSPAGAVAPEAGPGGRAERSPAGAVAPKAPLRGVAVVGAADERQLGKRLAGLAEAAEARTPTIGRPSDADLRAHERVAIDFGSAAELAGKAARALKALTAGEAAWKMLRGRGVFRGRGPAAKVAFLYTGQGSQYVNMLRTLSTSEPVVGRVFEEADAAMQPLLEGRRLTDYLFADSDDPAAMARAEEELRRTEITQPAVLAVDHALTRLLAAFDIRPDLVMGHSLGEYAALVAAGALPFEDALEAVSARGREMAGLDVEDRGLMAAVIAPLPEIERVVEAIPGNVVIANINSTSQAVIGGASAPVREAVEALRSAGHHAFELPVSHAFHTSIVAPASEPLKRALSRLRLRPPTTPVVANVSGQLYPRGPDAVPEMLDILGRQVASPVQFVKGLRTLYDCGVRVFVEVGPKRALQGFAEDVLGEHPDVVALLTNHPKWDDATTFNQALCGLYAAGLGTSAGESVPAPLVSTDKAAPKPIAEDRVSGTVPAAAAHHETGRVVPPALYEDLGRTVADFLEQRAPTEGALRPVLGRPVVVTGAALGLPGTERVFDPANIGRLLRGEQLIKSIPSDLRDGILDQHITRLVKRPDGSGSFEIIDDAADVIKLAARAQAFDPAAEFGLSGDRLPALDETTSMAIAAGFDAMNDAGIPLVQHYKTTHLGTRLPERWGLPDALRDDTGVIFASAFPGIDSFADYAHRYYTDRGRREQLAALEAVRASLTSGDGASGPAIGELDRRIGQLRTALADEPYVFDRRFLFRVLSMGHSQFAEVVGARGPNTQVNAACASTTQAIALAEDWILAGRCRRVVVVAADDVTSDNLLGWIGAGFLASGAAATDEVVEEAATPFDRRRHGMILGMGAAAVVVEDPEAAVERGIRPICDVLAAETANSAYHGTRLDVDHISQVMERLVSQAERRWGFDRRRAASETVFVSHETYTPARGGSASAEVEALRHVFGADASKIVMANTKGFTGHPMGVGIEDVVAIKGLETGLVPPIPNFKEADPDLGELNLSVGGSYPVRYALRLAAGFGSQISMALFRWVETPDGLRRDPEHLGYAYRIDDDARWKAWLAGFGGDHEAALEVVQHQLRVVDTGRAPAPHEVPAAPVQEVEVEPAPVEVAPATGLQREPAPEAAPAAPPQAAPSPTPPPAPAAPAVSEDEVREQVLALVADQTGYPQDMLEMDLDLEADLGVDTVKQAELFATVREAYGIPRDDNLKLRDFPTLTHVVRFVVERAGGTTEAAPAAPPQAVPVPARKATTDLTVGLDVCARVRRRVPVPVVRPPLSLCRPTGVRLDAGRRVVVATDEGGVGSALVDQLRQKGVEALVLDSVADCHRDELTNQITAWSTSGGVQGVYWLPALDVEPSVDDLDLAGWRAHLGNRVKLLSAIMRALYEQVSGPSTFLVTATRLGGRHGYDETGAIAPMGGAVTGFAKAYKRERPDCVVKAVDVEVSAGATDVADLLIEEAVGDPGAVEIGRADGLRWAIGLQDQPAPELRAGPNLGAEPTFVVTGAAGSIVSAIVDDLATAWGGTFHLLDLAPEPDAADPDLERFAADREGLKHELARRIRDHGGRPTPAMIERELAGLERRRAALDAIAAVTKAGGQAVYHSLDLRDPGAVARVMDTVRQRHGRVDVLLHAAGLDVSRLLCDKSDEEFDTVFDVKADGWFNLLKAVGSMPLGATVSFSSVAGRFGNGGQTDYSAASDLLCKATSGLRAVRPTTRALVIDWTAWEGIGMATRGSIPKMMERAGIDLLAPEVGVPWIRRELVSGGTGEVLVAGGLGVLTEEPEFDSIDADAVAAQRPGGPMIGTIAGMGVWRPLTVDTTLDPTAQPFLDHHRIDGTPVLPGVIGVEAFAEVASLVLPGWQAVSVEDVAFLAPFKFYRDQPRTVTVEATGTDAGAGDVLVECRLLGRRQLPNQSEPQVTTHFTGRVRLSPAREDDLQTAVTRAGAPSSRIADADAIYRIYFHGPAYQVLESSWRAGDWQIGLMAAGLPEDHQPPDQPYVGAPRLLELCFQTAGVWELATTGRLALPERLARVSLLQLSRAPEGRLHAVVSPVSGGEGFDAAVVDEAGRVHLEMSGYRTIALPAVVEPELLRPLQATIP